MPLEETLDLGCGTVYWSPGIDDEMVGGLVTSFERKAAWWHAAVLPSNCRVALFLTWCRVVLRYCYALK